MPLSDDEHAIVAGFAETVPVERRDAYLQSVMVTLSQCSTLSPQLVRKLASEEAHRFGRPFRRQHRW